MGQFKQILLCLSAFAIGPSNYRTCYEKTSSVATTNYDFIVIGGGTAGNVIANRLTEDPSVNVLLLEAGGSNIGVFDTTVPFFIGKMLRKTQFNWNFTTAPQPGLNGRSFPYSRGHILGGTSSINGMVYTRGSAEDFDRYAKVTGDPGWSWNNLQSYIRKNEVWTEPADNHNTTGQFDPAVHGFDGVNSVSLAGFSSATDDRVIRTTQQLPNEFPFNLDMNSGKPLGLGWIQSTIKKGLRSSSATSYLAPDIISRPNLHVLTNSRVLRLVKTSNAHEPLEIKGVEFIQGSDKNAPRIQVRASKEIICSAGVIGTPTILLNSGIGDRNELQEIGIKPLLHLPSVGKNASDQPFLKLKWSVNSKDTLDELGLNETKFNEVFKLWNETGKGPLGGLGPSHMAWLRLPKKASIFKKLEDPSAGEETPHIEFLITNAGGPIPSLGVTGHFFSIAVAIVSPASRGSIKLSSADPFQPPLIDLGLLTNEFDVFAMRSGIDSAKRFVSAPAWKDYILGPPAGLENITTEDQLNSYIRDNTGISCHVVGTAAMSAKNANFGVVDPDLRVKGAAGLRIVDGSIFPFIPSAHPLAPTYIIAERGADLIKATWNLT